MMILSIMLLMTFAGLALFAAQRSLLQEEYVPIRQEQNRRR